VDAAVRGRTEADKATREGKAASEVLRRQEHLHMDEQRALEGTIKELREALAAALLARGEEASKKVDILEMNKELRAVVEKLRLDADALQGQLNASERARLSEGSTLKTAVREQQKELQDKARLVARKSKELDESKQEAERRLLEVTARLEDECSTLRRRVAEAEAATKDLEGAAAAEDQRTQMLVEQLRDKGTMLTAQLEASLRAEIEHGRKTSSKNRELEATAHLLTEEKAMLVVVIEEARSTISDLQEDLLSARDTILDLTESLSESHTAREEASQRAANVLEALEPIRGGGGGGGGKGSQRRSHARSAAAEGLEAKGE
jgi:chromosome segregation ATPase